MKTTNEFVREIPIELYLKTLNNTINTDKSTFKQISEILSYEAQNYSKDILIGIDHSVSLATKDIAPYYRRFDYCKTRLTKKEIQGLCFAVLKGLDNRIYEIHASEEIKNKWRFSFTLPEDYETYLKEIVETTFPRQSYSNPKQTFFDKEKFLRNLKNELWAYFDQTYNLSEESK